MKTFIICLICMFSSFSLSAQTGEFWQELKSGYRYLNYSQNLESLQMSYLIFNDLTTRNQGSYFPDYYAALTLIYQTRHLQYVHEVDSLIDKSFIHIDAAELISPNNAEIETLRGYALSNKLSFDPENRGVELAPIIIAHYLKAMSMDPKNPRAPAFLAEDMRNLPQYFKVENVDACSLAKKSVDLFREYHVQNMLVWGLNVAEHIAQGCTNK